MNSSLNTLNHVHHFFLCYSFSLCVSLNIECVDCLEYPSRECLTLYLELLTFSWLFSVYHSFSLFSIVFFFLFLMLRSKDELLHIYNHFIEQMPSNRFYILLERMPFYLPLNDIHLLNTVLNSGYSEEENRRNEEKT